LKNQFSIWRLNMTVVFSIVVLAILEISLLVYMGFADWKFTSMLMVQANVVLYALYVASTQSNFSLLKSNSVIPVVARQLIFALLYTFILIWIWEFLYRDKIQVRIPGSTFYLILFISWILLSALGIVHLLISCIIEQEQRILLENGVQELKNEAELFKLRQQLHPHFLFNSLNSINALIGADPKLARTMLTKLSAFLRQTIRKEDSRLVALSAELEELDLYLDIEKVRFGDRLVILKDIPADLEGKEIPPFLLQPLVENAIKFGLYDTLGEVVIAITLRAEDHFYKFEISNPFDRNSVAPKGTGFGLSGVSRRLYLLYARNDLLQLAKSPGKSNNDIDIYIATLLIPIEKNTQN